MQILQHVYKNITRNIESVKCQIELITMFFTMHLNMENHCLMQTKYTTYQENSSPNNYDSLRIYCKMKVDVKVCKNN